MKSVEEISKNLKKRLADRYMYAIDSGESKASHLPIDEIIGLATKLKKETLASNGMADQVALDAEKYYLKKLQELHPTLHEKYLQTRNSDLSKEQKREIFSHLEEVFPDTEMKLEYIEKRMGLDIHLDREYVVQACDIIASRHINEDVGSLKALFTQRLNKVDDFNKYLNAVYFLDSVSISILFRKEMLEMIADNFTGQKIDLIFYKCLRLTHDGGHVGFHHLLDDHQGFDKDGNSLKFIAEADFYQLDKIKYIVNQLEKFGVISENTVLVSDYDLLKFKEYKPSYDKITTYLNCLQEYFHDENINLQLETKYFQNQIFNSSFTEIWESIDAGCGVYINSGEFIRIEDDYKKHFSQTMRNWDDERNHYYSVSSVARNIAEGNAISSKPTLVFGFGESTVHGERFNLKTEAKVPFLGLEKMKAKIQEKGIIPV